MPLTGASSAAQVVCACKGLLGDCGQVLTCQQDEEDTCKDVQSIRIVCIVLGAADHDVFFYAQGTNLDGLVRIDQTVGYMGLPGGQRLGRDMLVAGVAEVPDHFIDCTAISLTGAALFCGVAM